MSDFKASIGSTTSLSARSQSNSVSEDASSTSARTSASARTGRPYTDRNELLATIDEVDTIEGGIGGKNTSRGKNTLQLFPLKHCNNF